jgi:large subunit ribosomal protein L13
MQKTTMAKTGAVSRNWVVVDLKDKVLGRAATQIADILRGKTKVNYTAHAAMGDFVIAINASAVRLTGKKMTDEKSYFHSGFPGGIKEVSQSSLLKRDPQRLVRLAVHGMLPKNRLSRHLLKKLRVYRGSEHSLVAQRPQTVEI